VPACLEHRQVTQDLQVVLVNPQSIQVALDGFTVVVILTVEQSAGDGKQNIVGATASHA
jgi:hypothetical protein